MQNYPENKKAGVASLSIDGSGNCFLTETSTHKDSTMRIRVDELKNKIAFFEKQASDYAVLLADVELLTKQDRDWETIP